MGCDGGGHSDADADVGEPGSFVWRLAQLYGAERAVALDARLRAMLGTDRRPARTLWNEQDVVVITYGDSISHSGERPLRTLRRFLTDHLAGLISTVHVLPFYPYSSDDGFAVVDYRAVQPMLGDWQDIEALGTEFDLMFDLVLNHVSSRHHWFSQFLGDRVPGVDYFHVVDPHRDLSAVVRPRVKPLLAQFETDSGPKQVWATFSEDQIDLNFENPDVLFEMLDIFRQYILRGARFVRLDAVAFLWKRIGTPCIHLPQTHHVVKLMREVAESISPGTVVLTETNVPHAENVSYFGAGDEAHMVYQFSLPPLLLHALHTQDARYLTRWAAQLQAPPEGCTFFNFTASHDGIGLRPVEGLLPVAEIERLVRGMQRAGGYASARDLGGGRRAVYELNITYFDALQGTSESRGDGLQVPRFICSQLIVLGLQGIPALYIQTLIATANDHARVDQTGHFRAVNRSKWAWEHLQALLGDPTSPQARVLTALQQALSVRRTLRAFHPDARQHVVDLGPATFAVQRTPSGVGETVLAVANVTADSVTVCLPDSFCASGLWDLLSGTAVASGARVDRLQFAPYQVMWLRRRVSVADAR